MIMRQTHICGMHATTISSRSGSRSRSTDDDDDDDDDDQDDQDGARICFLGNQ